MQLWKRRRSTGWRDLTRRLDHRSGCHRLILIEHGSPATQCAGSSGPSAPERGTAGFDGKPARQFQARAPAAPGTDARPDVAAARNLAELGAMLGAFEGCGLKATATNLCFYRGAERAPLMIIGEAPGREEDLEGKPFVGRAGQLLDRMLTAIGIGRANVHITNIVYWRPPWKSHADPQEALTCRTFLERQVALVAPKVVLALGGTAAKALFDVADGIMRRARQMA